MLTAPSTSAHAYSSLSVDSKRRLEEGEFRFQLQVKDTDRSQREVERLDSFINTWIDKHEEYNPDDDNFVSKAFHEAELHQLDSIMQEQQVQHDAAIELRERQKDDYMKLLERNKVLKDE